MNNDDNTNNFLDSHRLPVEIFEPTLLWPVQVQAVRDANGYCVKPELDPDEPGFLKSWANAIKNGAENCWRDRSINYPEDLGPSYAEYLYFHPFVRNFLYATRDDIEATQHNNMYENRNLKILERVQQKSADSQLLFTYDMHLPQQGDTFELVTQFQIKRCWLYLIDTRVAILEIALRHQCTTNSGSTTRDRRTSNDKKSSPVDLDLSVVMKLQDIIRRVYSAYWDVYLNSATGNTVIKNHHMPRKIELKWGHEPPVTTEFGNIQATASEYPGDHDSAAMVQHIQQGPHDEWRKSLSGLPKKTDQTITENLHAIQEQFEYLSCHREPHTHSVLKKLIYPLTPVTLSDSSERCCGLNFEHIQDDRIPMMSYIAMGDLAPPAKKGNAARLISNGDWLRLAMLDDPGDSAVFPYSPDFFDENYPLNNYAYDRFWHPTGDAKDYAQITHGTRWLCSEFSFLAVGTANDRFFTDGFSGALAHYHHHYFSMFMIGILHRASLLQYKHRLAKAMNEMMDRGKPKDERDFNFRKKADDLQRELLRFRTMYWFSEVSNQVQGQELFSLLRKHLNLESLFNDVSQDIEMATELIASWEERQRSESAHALSVVGATFVLLMPLGLLLEKILEGAPVSINITALLAVTIILIGILMPVISLPNNWKWEWVWLTHLMRKTPYALRYSLSVLCLFFGLLILTGSLIVKNAESTSGEASVEKTSSKKP